MIRIRYYNFTFSKRENSDYLLINGELKNESGRHLEAVSFHVTLLNKEAEVAEIVITVRDVPNEATKKFEHCVEELEYDKVASQITHYEAYTESAY